MGDFNLSFAPTISKEGGYKLTNIKGDRGGQTYAGIARNRHPDWSGWTYIDRGEVPPTELVRSFYKEKFWTPIKGDLITNQEIASSIYDFGVNAGAEISIKLAQVVAGVQADCIVGEKTLAAWNAMDAKIFKMAFTLAKIARYRDIVRNNKNQLKFLMGWINRALEQSV